MLKKILAAAIVVAGAGFVSIDTADAAYCKARSPSAWGWGRAYSQSDARVRALAECAVRTPRGQVCRITHCSY